MDESLHRVQLDMPPGQEKHAREFHAGVLGVSQIDKPPALAERGAPWFCAGGLELHLGVEEEFRPARKSHPGR